MNEVCLIVLIGFAVLGIYFIFETLRKAFSKNNCRCAVILYVPGENKTKVNLSEEIITLRNSLPYADIICTAEQDTAKSLRSIWCEYGINVVDARRLTERVEAWADLQNKK